MIKDEVKKLRMDSPESLQFLNNATKFYNLMMMYRCAIREIQTKLEVLDDEFSVENNRNPISFIKTINEQISNFAQTYPTNLKASSNEALLFMRRYRFANCSCFSCCFKDAYPSSNVQ